MERDFLTIEPPPTFQYNSFAPGDPLLYLFYAECTDGVLRLTPAAENLLGEAWRDVPYDLSHGFSTSFEFQIADCNSEGGGVGGFTFNVHSYGSAHIGAVGVDGVQQNFCVQFITHRDEGGGGPSDNFIRVFFYGETWVVYDMSGGNGFNLKDGQPHVVTIEIVEGHKLRVWHGTWKMKRSELLFEQPGTYFDHFERAFVGLTASTGFAFCRQDIRRWSLTAGPEIKRVRRPSLVGWWPGNNSPEDVAGGHNPVRTADIKYADGRVGRAFQMGINSWLQMRPSVLLDVGSSPEGFTLEAWVKPAATNFGVPGGGVVFEWENTLTLGVTTSRIYGNIVEMDGEGTVMHELASPDGILQPEVFYHVALTYDRPNGVAKLYRNGAPVTTETLGSFCVSTIETMHIGRHMPSESFFGRIDEPKIYSRSLSQEELTANYQAGLAGTSTGVTVSGSVSDENGEAMQGVTLVLHNVDTLGASRSGRVTSTDRRGAFIFRDVPRGYHYRVFPLESAEQYDPPVHELSDLNEPQRVGFRHTPLLLKTQKSEGDAEK